MQPHAKFIARAICGLIFALILADSQNTRAATNLAQAVNTTGWKIFEPQSSYDYRYGPSIMINSDNSIDMWLASPGASGEWDCIRYRRSTTYGLSWTPDQIVLQPTVPGAAGSEDSLSCCDPGVIKIGSYYYIAYTSMGNFSSIVSGALGPNHIFLARSTSMTGPYYKWNGVGWGSASDLPQPIISSEMGTASFGCAEPSMVLKDGKIYLYYTVVDVAGFVYTDLAISDNSSLEDWPSHFIRKGHVITKSSVYEDSLDAKYVDTYSRFFGIFVHNRMMPNSAVACMQSDDGILWQPASIRGSPIQFGAHNIGISGTADGHYDTSKSNFISYSVWPETGYIWGKWPTWLDNISLTTVAFGAPWFAMSSSRISNWDNPKLIDGDNSTVWSSLDHATATASEWAGIDLGANFDVTQITIQPRTNGLCFPVRFRLEYSTDATNWTMIPGQDYTAQDYPNPGSTPVVKQFSAVNARYFRLLASKLASDGSAYYLHLAEFSVSVTASTLPTAPTLISPATGATNVVLQPSLDWGDISAATSYRLMVADNTAFNNPVFVKTAVATSSYWLDSSIIGITNLLKDGTTYYWKVAAFNGAGYGPYSTASSFSTGSAHDSYCMNTGTGCSSQYDNTWKADNLIDFNASTCWSSTLYGDNPNHIEWAQVNIGALYQIGQVHIRPRSDGANFPKDFQIQYSPDGTNWNTALSYTGYPTPANGDLLAFILPAPVAAQYLRVYVTKLGSEGSIYACQLAELEPVLHVTAIPADSYATITSCSASSFISGWEVAKAWDGNMSSCWSSIPRGNANYTEWISLNMGSQRKIKGIVLYPTSTGLCYPIDFKFQYGSNGTTWTDVPNTAMLSHAKPNDGFAQSRTYLFPGVIAAQYLRIYATRLSSDGSAYYFQLADVKPILYDSSATSTLASARYDSLSTATSILAGWPIKNAMDSNAATCWSSSAHGSATASETIQLRLGDRRMIRRIGLVPRTSGLCFPQDFQIECSSDNRNWQILPGQKYTGYPVVSTSDEQIFQLRYPVVCSYIRVTATKLRSDGYNYYFHLAEINAYEQ